MRKDFELKVKSFAPRWHAVETEVRIMVERVRSITDRLTLSIRKREDPQPAKDKQPNKIVLLDEIAGGRDGWPVVICLMVRFDNFLIKVGVDLVDGARKKTVKRVIRRVLAELYPEPVAQTHTVTLSGSVTSQANFGSVKKPEVIGEGAERFVRQVEKVPPALTRFGKYFPFPKWIERPKFNMPVVVEPLPAMPQAALPEVLIPEPEVVSTEGKPAEVISEVAAEVKQISTPAVLMVKKEKIRRVRKKLPLVTHGAIRNWRFVEAVLKLLRETAGKGATVSVKESAEAITKKWSYNDASVRKFLVSLDKKDYIRLRGRTVSLLKKSEEKRVLKKHFE